MREIAIIVIITVGTTGVSSVICGVNGVWIYLLAFSPGWYRMVQHYRLTTDIVSACSPYYSYRVTWAVADKVPPVIDQRKLTPRA
jgi:K+ transporter